MRRQLRQLRWIFKLRSSALKIPKYVKILTEFFIYCLIRS